MTTNFNPKIGEYAISREKVVRICAPTEWPRVRVQDIHSLQTWEIEIGYLRPFEPKRETPDSVAAMQLELFGKPDSNHVITRLQHEFRELQTELDLDGGMMTEKNEEAILEEAIDIVNYVSALFVSCGRSMQDKWNEKNAIVRTRKWRKVGIGVAQHVKES